MQSLNKNITILDDLKKKYPEKFIPLKKAFGSIRGAGNIFISTACAKPQFLVKEFVEFVRKNPKAFTDSEIIHVWSLGVAPYMDERLKNTVRYNCYFIGKSSREAVNKGEADYSPIFFSGVPQLFNRGLVKIDAALIQTSMPDHNGMVSLGISIDIVKAAVENSSMVFAQINPQMPRVHGNTFINVEDIDFLYPHDEPLLEYESGTPDAISEQIGKYVSRLVKDGDTIQVGYGSLPNAIMANLHKKKNLGIHTELLSDGMVDLIRSGAVDNSRKTIDRGKTVATFCMGRKSTYDFLDDNPSIAFKTVDYTNNPLVISNINNIVSINAALQVDLTGQATADSLGNYFYSGIGGHADFMRGALLAHGGRTVLTVRATAMNNTVSRIVPMIDQGAGVTLNRGDVYYVVSEFGIAYIHGKNMWERVMDLIAIANPKFRPWLVREAKKLGLLPQDMDYLPGDKHSYPSHLESYRTTRDGIRLLLRPVKTGDESMVMDLFNSLEDGSVESRFFRGNEGEEKDKRYDFGTFDYSSGNTILAVRKDGKKEYLLGIGQYVINELFHSADVDFVVRDDYKNRGIGSVILDYMIHLAKWSGLFCFTAEVKVENKVVMHLLENSGFDIKRSIGSGVYEMETSFTEFL